MIIGTFKGANIISLPTRPGPKQVEFAYNNSNAQNRSPYTGYTQVQPWAGGQWWEANISLPQMVLADASVWTAFLAECYGTQNVFWLGDPLHRDPRGVASGTPVVNGIQNAMNTVLNTKGWTASTTRLLMPGDMLQLGTYLHRVTCEVTSDANGNAPISIWPTIREVTTGAETINLKHPKGLFRMAENRQSITANETRLSAVTLKCIEAR